MTRSLRLAVACLSSALGLSVGVQFAAAQTAARLAHPTVRVTEKVDRGVTSTLRGTHPGALAGAAVGGRLSPGTRLQHMILVLKPSDDQETALRSLLDAQQDKGSASFHQWLTPDTFNAGYGVASADIAKVSAWLTDSGNSVESVSRSGRFITFSGTVASVEGTFSTEMHNVTVNGEAHITNTTDVTIPSALAPVVKGVKSLNDFFPKAKNVGAHKISLEKSPAGGYQAVNSTDPLYTSGSGAHYVAPGDLATIFNATPLTAAGTTGKGITISVLARSNIQLADVEAYRSLFGLPKNDPNIIVVGTDPGENSDDVEAFLDAELSGSLATGATVNFLVSGASLVGSGIDTAGLYAVDNNSGDIITLSYGGCEGDNGESGTAFWNDLWEEAAAQGQTAFVSSGDSSAAGCDSSGASYASGGYGVNALGSSAYNVAVGGSMFADYNPTQYWGPASTFIPYSNALGYIPEAAWNQGLLSTTYLNTAATAAQTGSGIVGGGGGISIYTARPSWQTGSGIPTGADAIAVYSGTGIAAGSTVTGLHRLVPDVAFIAASGHDGTLFCYEGGCYENASGGLISAGVVGGTSVAAPAMASVQALIDAANGGRQGNANFYYYPLANAQYTASATACQAPIGTAANPSVVLPAASCNFHDIVAGSNVVPTNAAGTAGLGFSSAVGFDEASGLGSVNIANLAANWKSVTFHATTTTLALTPTAGTHGANQTATVQVAAVSGGGTPTGDVSIIASAQTAYGAPQIFTLAGGSVTGLVNSLPAGSYTVHAHYAGDGTYASSDSNSVAVTIGKEASTTALQTYLVTAAGSVTTPSTFTYGSGEIYLYTAVNGNSGNGTASGAVAYTVTDNGLTLPGISNKLDTYGTTYLLAGPSFANFYLVADYPTLSPGSYVVKAAYAGDTSFTASTATASFTVLPATPAVTFSAATAQIQSGSAATLTFTVATPTAATPATGSVQIVDTTSGKPLGLATLTNGSVTVTTSGMTVPGANTLTALYSGDGNYSAATATTTVTVSTPAATAVKLAPSTASPFVGTNVTLSATVSPVPSAAALVYFYDSGRLLGSATASTTTGIASLAGTTYTAGVHNLTATFAGDTGQGTSTGVYSLSVAQNVTSIDFSGGETSTVGQTVSFNAYIVRSPTTSTVPAVPLTGTVNFYDGGPNGTLIGSAAPVFGPGGGRYVATLNVSTLALGSHTIVAVYPGDANYAASTSIAAPLVVSGGTPNLLATSTISALSGGGYVATVTVTNTGNGIASNVVLAGVTIGGVQGTPLPQALGSLQPNATITTTVTVPASAGADGARAVEAITGTYTGGTFGGSLRVTLP